MKNMRRREKKNKNKAALQLTTKWQTLLSFWTTILCSRLWTLPKSNLKKGRKKGARKKNNILAQYMMPSPSSDATLHLLLPACQRAERSRGVGSKAKRERARERPQGSGGVHFRVSGVPCPNRRRRSLVVSRSHMSTRLDDLWTKSQLYMPEGEEIARRLNSTYQRGSTIYVTRVNDICQKATIARRLGSIC
jgi:hypothetical protein